MIDYVIQIPCALFLTCFLAITIAAPYRANEELHLRRDSLDILRSRESRWGWGDGGVDVGARAEAAGIAAARDVDIDGFGGRRDVEIDAARAGADFIAGGFGGGW